MPHLGATELMLILAVITLLFGVGRISKVAGEFGRGIRLFKQEINQDK